MSRKKSKKRAASRARPKVVSLRDALAAVRTAKAKAGLSDSEYKMLCGCEGSLRKIIG